MDIRSQDPEYVADCIVHLSGVIALTAAGWHFAGWWGVVTVQGLIATRRRTRKAKP